MVRYGLWVEVKDLSQDYGKMKIVSEICWGFPEFQDPSTRLQKNVNFEYDDFQVFKIEKMALVLLELRASHHPRPTNKRVCLAWRPADERPALLVADTSID